MAGVILTVNKSFYSILIPSESSLQKINVSVGEDEGFVRLSLIDKVLNGACEEMKIFDKVNTFFNKEQVYPTVFKLLKLEANPNRIEPHTAI